MSFERRHIVIPLRVQSLALSLVIVATFVSGCVVRGTAKIPFAHAHEPFRGADYTTTYLTPQSVPVMFKMDGKRNVFAAQRGHIPSLDKNVTVFYFKPRQSKLTDSSLNAQVADIWVRYKNELLKGDLDLLILRCMPHNPTMITYNYVYAKNGKGKWLRLQDEDYLNRIVQSQV
jgi:hypothetical protein